MTRRWHVEHRDGRTWTQGELDRLVRDTRERGSRHPFGEDCWYVCMDGDGSLFLLDSGGEWHCVADDDMVVVSDE